jgi:hypothetical protein
MFFSVFAAMRSVSSALRSSLISSFLGAFAMPKDILNPNPFANPLIAKRGDKSPSEIHLAVGMALDNWEHCEASFATIYSALVKPEGSDDMLMRAFGTIAAPATRREMTWEACDAYFSYHPNKALKAEVRHLLNLYKDAAARRNEIAHGNVIGLSLPLPTTWYLAPAIYSTRKTHMLPTDMKEPFGGVHKYRYSTREIFRFISCFQALDKRASAAMRSIRDFYKSLPEKDRSP